MAKKQIRVCDRCGGPDADTIVVLLGAQSKREDLCPSCSLVIREQWDLMPTPKESRSSRRLSVVSMAEVEAAAKAARGARRAQGPR